MSENCNSWFWLFIMALVTSLVVVFMLKSTFDEQVFTSKYRQMVQQAIEACEKDLPRDQKCKVVISAKVKE